MNEIDFARGCRAVRTGDLVVFSDDDAATVDPEEADAVGFAVRFVDPTKPLLLFRTREERRTGFRIDFFQDVLYGTGSPIRARRFSVWRPVAAGGSNVRGNTEDPPQVVRWRQRIAVAIGCPLDTETELFDAYATGALNYKVWERALEDGKVDTDKVRVIWETPPYPDYHWTVRGDLDERFGDGFTERVTDALLAIDDPALLEAFPRHRFVPASNDDYQAIEDTAEAIGLLD